MPTRRGFLGQLFKTAAGLYVMGEEGPELVKKIFASGQLDNRLWLWGDGKTNDHPGLQGLIDGKEVWDKRTGKVFVSGLPFSPKQVIISPRRVIISGNFFVEDTIVIRNGVSIRDSSIRTNFADFDKPVIKVTTQEQVEIINNYIYLESPGIGVSFDASVFETIPPVNIKWP